MAIYPTNLLPKQTRWAAFVVYIGSFLQSYSICVIAGSLFFISSEFGLTPFEEGKVASSILLGAIVGTFLSGILADSIGRRPTLFLTTAIFFLMALSSVLIGSFWHFIAMRFATGIAAGISSMLVPMYLAEIAPLEKRGGFVSGYELSITLGVLAAYVMSYLGSILQDWRPMYLVTAFPAFLQLILLLFLPESPKWLQYSSKKREDIPSVSLFSSRFLLILSTGFVLSAFQQLCGFNAVLCFTPKIFCEAGFTTCQGTTFISIFIGLVHVAATLISLFLIDRIGRRKLLIFSQAGVLAMLLVLMFSFRANTLMLSVGAIIFFVMFYSVGLGPIVWVLISEIFPLPVRAKAISFLTFVSWSSSYVIILSFPHFLASYDISGTLAVFALFSIGALIFYLRFIPETKGKSLEELESMLAPSENL